MLISESTRKARRYQKQAFSPRRVPVIGKERVNLECSRLHNKSLQGRLEVIELHDRLRSFFIMTKPESPDLSAYPVVGYKHLEHQ